MIGIPARMNTANWRVKFMTSWRGTFFLVISNFARPCLLSTSVGWSPRASSATCAAPADVAISVPGDRLPGVVQGRVLELEEVFSCLP